MALSTIISISVTPTKKDTTVALNANEDYVGSDDSAENSANDTGDDDIGNAGWADSIAKVLNTTKPKSKKTLVLSRAKKNKPGIDNTKKKKTYDFEVDGEITQVKDEKPTKEQLIDESHKQRNKQLALRMRPSWKDLERERSLRKIATRGVVQLFNAVRIQQKDLEEQLDEAGPLESRKDAVLNNINKRKFLDVLMSGKRSKSETVDNPIKYETKQESTNESEEDEEVEHSKKKKKEWNVLRSDFMTNKKIKHWDESDDDDDSDSQNVQQHEADDSDDDDDV